MYIFHWLLESPKRIVMSLIHLAIVYALIYYFLFCMQNDVEIARASLYLLGLSVLAMLSCPLTNKLFKHITGCCDKSCDKKPMGSAPYNDHMR